MKSVSSPLLLRLVVSGAPKLPQGDEGGIRPPKAFVFAFQFQIVAFGEASAACRFLEHVGFNFGIVC